MVLAITTAAAIAAKVVVRAAKVAARVVTAERMAVPKDVRKVALKDAATAAMRAMAAAEVTAMPHVANVPTWTTNSAHQTTWVAWVLKLQPQRKVTPLAKSNATNAHHAVTATSVETGHPVVQTVLSVQNKATAQLTLPPKSAQTTKVPQKVTTSRAKIAKAGGVATAMVAIATTVDHAKTKVTWSKVANRRNWDLQMLPPRKRPSRINLDLKVAKDASAAHVTVMDASVAPARTEVNAPNAVKQLQLTHPHPVLHLPKLKCQRQRQPQPLLRRLWPQHRLP